MKHYLVIVAFLLIVVSFFSCSRIEVNSLNNEKDYQVFPLSTRSLGEYMDNKGYDVTPRMAELFIRSDKNTPNIIRIDPFVVDKCICFYVFNFEKGFKIVSADTRINPVLAESEEENLFLDQVHDGIRVWLEDTGEIISKVKTYDIITNEDYSSFWAAYKADSSKIIQTKSWPNNPDSIWVKLVDYSSSVYSCDAHVLPLLQTKWGQDAPWNVSMPEIKGNKCKTCCVAVAISQVLYYFYVLNHIPNDFWHSITISGFTNRIVTLNKTNYTLNSSRWYNMPLLASTGYHQYASDLMLDIGERLPVQYGTDGSVVTLNSDYSIPNLSQCGISSSFGSYSFSNVKSSLVNNSPVIVTAWPNSNNYGIGHTWVIDGCDDYVLKNTTIETYYYVSVNDLDDYPDQVALYTNEQIHMLYPNAYDGMQMSNTAYVPVQRLQMNWGYDGEGDDSYYGILDTSNWECPHGNNNYRYSRYIHYNTSASQIN